LLIIQKIAYQDGNMISDCSRNIFNTYFEAVANFMIFNPTYHWQQLQNMDEFKQN